jgi:PAS domain-containing protein
MTEKADLFLPQKPKLPRGKKGWSVTQEADARSYRLLFEAAPVGIFRSTPAGRFIEVNPALVQMLGYASVEDVLALQLPDGLYGDPAHRQALRAQYEASGLLDGVAVRWRRTDRSVLNNYTLGRKPRDKLVG